LNHDLLPGESHWLVTGLHEIYRHASVPRTQDAGRDLDDSCERALVTHRTCALSVAGVRAEMLRTTEDAGQRLALLSR
jgi:hypothetical protein